MTFNKTQFIKALLSAGVLKFGEFTLKSGRISPYFFNAGLLCDGKALAMLSAGYAQILSKNIQNTDELAIFGAAYKGIPFVASTAQALYLTHSINVAWGYNRKEPKTHGEGGNLVGVPLNGKSVWVIDDVMTAGTAIREVATLLKDNGAKLSGIIIALDRKEKGQYQKSAVEQIKEDYGVPVYSLIDIDDIIDYMKQENNKQLEAMQNYRSMYGVLS